MPDSQDLFIQATELVEMVRLDEALALFQTLLKTDSDNATLWNNTGIILFRQATELVEMVRLDEALALFQTLLKTDSDNATLWNNTGIIVFRQGKISRGTECIRSGIGY